MFETNATIIVNADDWGRDIHTTNCIKDCAFRETVSSVSAMTFMEDSERAADLALEHGVDAGLHLNLTSIFSARQCPLQLIEHQQKISRFLRSHRLAPVVYHPGLACSFEYVAKAQLEEFERLYRAPAKRVDGHHHMHLCANVFFQRLLPAGTIVRRNVSFGPQEKSRANRFYRSWQDRGLARRHRLTDYFFALPPIDSPSHIEKIFDLATRFNVEVETHPANRAEYEFLVDGEIMNRAHNVTIARSYLLRSDDRFPNKGHVS